MPVRGGGCTVDRNKREGHRVEGIVGQLRKFPHLATMGRLDRVYCCDTLAMPERGSDNVHTAVVAGPRLQERPPKSNQRPAEVKANNLSKLTLPPVDATHIIHPYCEKYQSLEIPWPQIGGAAPLNLARTPRSYKQLP